MQHKIRNKSENILVIIDHGKMMLRLKHLPDNSAQISFNAFYTQWISSVFDAPVYVIVDRGSNLFAEYMKRELHEVESQLFPVPTEAPWGIKLNERSHRYMHKIDWLLRQSQYYTGNYHEVLLPKAATGWNYALHKNNVLPHYHRLGIMPRTIASLDEFSRLSERVALIELARIETASLRACDFITRALDINHRRIGPSKSFAVQEKVWFHRHQHEWRQAIVASIDPPTIMVEYYVKLYLIHESLVRPFSGELSVPPPLKGDQLVHDRPDASLGTTVACRTPLSDILSTGFVASHSPVDIFLDFEISGTTISVSVRQLETLDIDSDSVFLTVTKAIKDHNSLSDADKKAFEISKREEIDFLLKHAVQPILIEHVPDSVELQPLKWVIAKKTNTADESKNWHSSRIVSASHRSAPHHSVHGNAPTVMLSTLRILSMVLPTWIQMSLKMSPKDRIVIFCLDVLEAFIQSDKSQVLIIYKPPQDFFAVYPQFHRHVLQANI